MVNNVKVNGVSVVDSEGIAQVDLTDYALKTYVDSEGQRLEALINAEAAKARNIEAGLQGQVTATYLIVVNEKQDKLTAGEGIVLTSEGLISANGKIQDVLVDSASVVDSEGIAKIELAPYATIAWVNSEGFLKEHQDISHLATITYVDSEANRLEDLIDAEEVRAAAAETSLNVLIGDKQDKLEAGNYIVINSEGIIDVKKNSIVRNVFVNNVSVVDENRDAMIDLTDYATKDLLNEGLDTKQKKLIAGDNIELDSEGNIDVSKDIPLFRFDRLSRTLYITSRN